ncbi:PREDICTED: uncharacterized protein LOC104727846 [Camelina sativa]|uniref:Uncharacterized protein LOC104727846 n=1 Tax=Camelina sativa TaxID=90675 RepID=A0ABM0URW5_CAMSA|nr:PREDICTED: uncharacterized protein LOC104727846 [Camelina sativa]
MQQNIINVEFKFEIYDERTKRKAMEVIANFTGVTTVEWKENGKLKVKGKFDSHEMTTKFKKICKHIAIFKLTTDEGPDQNRAMVMYEPRQEQNQAPVTRREARQEPNRAVTRREPQEQNRVRFTRREPRQEQNRAMVIWRETRPEHNPHPRVV